MASRRTFLKHVAALATAAAGAAADRQSQGEGRPAGGRDVANQKEEPAGDESAGLVPDTLELAEHGRLALGGVLGSMDQAVGCEPYFLAFFNVHPAYMVHFSSTVSGVMPKYLEALPMLRLMSGSRQQMDIQDGFMAAMLSNMAEDGLVYDRVQANRPWNTGVQYGVQHWDEDYANMAGNGRLLAGLIYWRQWTGDSKWQELAKKTAQRMLDLALVRGDVAYYPNPGLGNDFSYPRQSGWTNTDPPKGPGEGFEGATLFYLWQPLRGFVRYAALTGDERFLKLSRKFVNLGMQAKFWGAQDDVYKAAGAQRGHFQGHYHGNLAALRGLLDYASAADDDRLMLFVRDAYDWARQNGISRLGLFNGSGNTEGCTVADMVGLAVALTDAGVGDYWDDVRAIRPQRPHRGPIHQPGGDGAGVGGGAKPAQGFALWRDLRAPLRPRQHADRPPAARLERPRVHGPRHRPLPGHVRPGQGSAVSGDDRELLHRQLRPGPLLRLGGNRPRPRRRGGSEPLAQPPLALVRRLELAPLRRQARGPEQGAAAAGGPQARLGAASDGPLPDRRARRRADLARQPHFLRWPEGKRTDRSPGPLGR